MFIISEKQMLDSRDFPTLKCKMALNLQWIHIAHYRKLKIAQLNAIARLRFSLQFTADNWKITLKLGNLENQTFAFSLIMNI